MAVLRVATGRILTEFFSFCLRLRTGKKGQKLPGIGKLSSLGQDWKSFLRYYEKATGVLLDEDLGRKMSKVSSIYAMRTASPLFDLLPDLDFGSVYGN